MSSPNPLIELLATERLLLEQKERHEYLARRQLDLEGELRTLHEEIVETVAHLNDVGRERVEFGDLRRLTPISPVWGLDRGIPLDRDHIHHFLDRHRADIRGRVLEVKDSGYTRAFGDDRVTASDVLDIDSTNIKATVVTDLSHADAIADDTYDCFILTQTSELFLMSPVHCATLFAYSSLVVYYSAQCQPRGGSHTKKASTGITGVSQKPRYVVYSRFIFRSTHPRLRATATCWRRPRSSTDWPRTS